MYACLAVTCHLHFWQNDRDFLRATVVTRGWNGYRNKSQHRKSTLEKKILPPFQQGFEPATFQSRVRCSNHWAIPAPKPCWAFSLGSNTCPQGNRLWKISSSTKDEAPTPLPVVGPLLISPLSFYLSRAFLGAWRFGLFRCVYSSFHNRLDLITEPAFCWVFYFIFPIYPRLFHHT